MKKTFLKLAAVSMILVCCFFIGMGVAQANELAVDEADIVEASSVTVTGVSITKNPTRLMYDEDDEVIDPSGMQVTLSFSDGGNTVWTYKKDSLPTYKGVAYNLTVSCTPRIKSSNNNHIVVSSGRYTDTVDLTVYKASTGTSGVWTYRTLLNGKVELIKYQGSAANIIIPATVGGKKVGALGVELFYHKDFIQSVSVPATVEIIRKDAFERCDNLKKVDLKNGLKQICVYAFAENPNLNDVSIPSTVTYLGNYAFQNSGVTNLVIPEGIDEVPSGFARGCTKLKSVTIPSTVKKMCTDVFKGCTSLSTYNVAGDKFFVYYGCLYMKNYTGNSGAMLMFVNANTVNCLIKEGTKAINIDGFSVSNKINSITLPESLKSSYKVLTDENPISIDSHTGDAFMVLIVPHNTGIYKAVSSTDVNSQLMYLHKGKVEGFQYYDNSTDDSSYFKTVNMSLEKITYGQCSDNISYTYDAAKEKVTFAGTGDITDYPKCLAQAKAAVISEGITGIPSMFLANGNISTISVAKSVTNIGSSSIFKGTVYGYTYSRAEQVTKWYGGTFCDLNKTSIAGASVTGVAAKYTCTGKALCPKVNVTLKGTALTKDKDYTVEYTDNTNAGTGTVTITGIGNYRGTIKKTFKIAPGKAVIQSLSNDSKGVTIKWTRPAGATGYYIYRKAGNGSWTKVATISKAWVLNYTDTKAANGTSYTYLVRSFGGNVNGADSNTKVIVRLAAPSIASLSNSAAGKVTVKWNRNYSASGYEILYKNGSSSKTMVVYGSSVLSRVISGLRKNASYQVAVRAYKTVGNVKYYSAWSTQKTIKITK